MEHRTVFLALLTVFVLTILTLVCIPLARAAGPDEAQTAPYVDPAMAMAPAPSRCSSMFEILDVDRDGHINREEAKKSAETTATWKSLDGDRDNRISYAEYCTPRK